MPVEKNIAVVCNPIAGGGKGIVKTQRIAHELSERNIRYSVFVEVWPDDFIGFSEVWVVGGDGTINYFINKYPGINLPLALFDGGTGNDLYWVLYKNMSFADQVRTVLAAEPRRIDAGRCNERYFINGVGIGFEGAVSKSLTGKKKTKPGKAAFMGTILRTIFTYRSEKYRIMSEEYSTEGVKLLISIMNGHRAGGGFHVAPSSSIDDALLDVIISEKLHPFQRLRWLPVIEKGKHLGQPFIQHFKTKRIIVTSEKKIDAHLDGEYFSAHRLEIEMLPAKYFFRY